MSSKPKISANFSLSVQINFLLLAAIYSLRDSLYMYVYRKIVLLCHFFYTQYLERKKMRKPYIEWSVNFTPNSIFNGHVLYICENENIHRINL